MANPIRRTSLTTVVAVAGLTAALAILVAAGRSLSAQSARMPQYNKDRALMLPADYRQWVDRKSVV